LSLHELIREYVAEKLRQEENDWAEVAQRHAQHYLGLIERAVPHFFRLEQVQWLPVLNLELDNFRAALTWALSGGDAVLALQLANALTDFFQLKGLLREGAQWLIASLDAAQDQAAPSPLLAEAWMSLAHLQLQYGDLHLSVQNVQHAIGIARALPDTTLESRAHSIWARALNRLGQFTQMRQVCLAALELPQEPSSRTVALAWLGQAEFMLGQDLETAKKYLAQALQMMRLGGAIGGIALLQQALGGIAAEQADFATARACLQEAIVLSRQIHNPFGETLHTTTLGRVELQAGDLQAAQMYFGQALDLAQNLAANRDIGYCQIQLGHIANRRGEAALAWQHYQSALKLARELADQRLQLEVVGGMANLYAALGDQHQAAQYLGLALGHEQTNREVAWLLADTHAALGHLDSAKRRGLERGLDQTVSLLLASQFTDTKNVVG
jgi:tetratricopeptide (TPR) repeat protein